MRRPLLLIAVLASALSVSIGTASALPVLSHHGRWLTDPLGRVVILHGLQIDNVNSADLEEVNLTPENVAFLGAEGFNLARVSIDLSGYEPAPNSYDPAYLAQFVTLDNELAQSGVYDLVNMMQGQFSAEFEGGGFPNWMAETNGVPNQPGPFPQSYLYDPAEERAWDNFWANAPGPGGTGLQDDYGAALERIAASYKNAPGYLGIDLLNEPWAGSQYPSCANPEGCPAFDAELNAFYRRIIPALRKADPRHPVFYEPHALFDQGAATHLGSVGDPNAVFTFHNYCLGDQPGLPQMDPGQDCGTEEEIVLHNAEAQADASGDALLEDEWGNTTSLPLLDRMTNEADGAMVGWSYWAYCCNSEGEIVKNGAQGPTAPGNLNLSVLNALVRPYPKLIAGTPRSWSYDSTGDTFSLDYSTRPVGGGRFPEGADTEIELPALRYPTGYTALVQGARVISAPDANLLRLVSSPRARTVTVTVRPANHHPSAPGPFSWRAGGNVVPADCSAHAVLTIPVRVRGTHSVRFEVEIDGQRVESRRERRIRRITLPPGLADGTQIRLVATAAGRSQTAARRLHGCAATPQSVWIINAH